MNCNQIVKLQKHINQLREDILDIFHATSLNHSSLLLNLNPIQSQSFQRKSDQEQFSKTKLYSHYKTILSKIKKMENIFQKRAEIHLNYLIIKQIQSEEFSVRKDRLTDYQDKIYDLRRLISDKQTFLQSLYHPKKKRPQHMTTEDFHEIRAKQKASQELLKIQSMNKQKKQLEQLKHYFKNLKEFSLSNQNKENVCEYKKNLQLTKASSIQNVNNISAIAINETCLNQQTNYLGISEINISMGRRHSTNEINKQNFSVHNTNNISILDKIHKKQTKQVKLEQINKIKIMLESILTLKEQNKIMESQRKKSNGQNQQLKKQVQKFKKIYLQKIKRLEDYKKVEQPKKINKICNKFQLYSKIGKNYPLWI